MNTLTHVLSAISHPARRAIIARLSRGSARVCEIAAPFELSLNAVSKHLKVLEHAGLIKREKQWRDHIIKFNAEPLRQVFGWIHIYEKFWNTQLDELESVFKERKNKK